MAFKMNPKSPALMKAMGYASPAKQSKNMTPEEEKALNDKSVFGPDGKNVAKPPKGGSNTKADALFEEIVKRSTTTPKKGNKNVKGEKYSKSPAKQRTGGHRIKKKTLVKKLPELGNKNAEMGADGKMTIITANMAKNQKFPKMMKLLKEKKQELAKVKSPAKQSKRTTRLQNKEAKETNKIIRGEKTSARKVNRLNDRLEVSKAKDKVKAVRKSQRAQKLKDKAAVLNNKAQG